MDKTQLLRRLAALGLPQAEYWLVGGGAMVLYGLREETADIDLGCTARLAGELEARGCPTVRMEDGTRRITLGPQCEVFENWLSGPVELVEGVPAVSLQGLLDMKRALGREKDLADIEKIRRRLGQGRESAV